VTFAFLHDHPRFREPLAELHGREWGHLYRDWNAAAALREFRNQRGDGRIPATLLILDDQSLAGSVSLVFDDLPARPDLNPWLASLFVLPEYRGRGLARRLIARAGELFAANGCARFYLFTESGEPLFSRLGFRPLAAAECNRHPILIMQSP